LYEHESGQHGKSEFRHVSDPPSLMVDQFRPAGICARAVT
jgi:hypothetical protein